MVEIKINLLLRILSTHLVLNWSFEQFALNKSKNRLQENEIKKTASTNVQISTIDTISPEKHFHQPFAADADDQNLSFSIEARWWWNNKHQSSKQTPQPLV